MSSKRRLAAGVLVQGTDEVIDYQFDFKNYVQDFGAPSAEGTCTLEDTTTGTDVSATKLSGSSSLIGTVVTTPMVIDLVASHRYKLTQAAEFTGGQVLSAYLVIRGE